MSDESKLTPWVDARRRTYAVTASIVVMVNDEPIERDQFEFTQRGLVDLPMTLAKQVTARFGSDVNPEYFKLWKRRLQVLRGSLSYHNGAHGTFALPVNIKGEDGFIRVVARRVDAAEQAQRFHATQGTN